MTDLDGEYALVDVSSGNIVEVSNGAPGVAPESFEVTSQNLDAEFDSTDVTTDTNDNELTIDSNRGTYNVTVDADGDLSASELEGMFDANFTVASNNSDGDDDQITLENPEGSNDVDFTGVDAGEYTFNFNVEDTSASSSALGQRERSWRRVR